jgi:shikimate-5-dehydrogenase
VLRAQGTVLSAVPPAGGAVHRAAVLGCPIAHSLSPALHTAAYAVLGLEDWAYTAHEVTEHDLPGFVAGLGPEWAGLSLTMPLKEVAFAVTREVSPLAREVGAVNTLVRLPGGGWSADNTDVHGMTRALQEAGAVDAVATSGHALVLGSGATARSAVASLAELGARQVTFAVRGSARTETVAQARDRGMVVLQCGLGDLSAVLPEVSLVVSTLPGGAAPAGVLGDAPDLGGRLLLDVVYAGWPTPLAQAFEAAGGRVVSGFEMLLHQAARQVELMTGHAAPVAAMRAAGLAAMGHQ